MARQYYQITSDEVLEKSKILYDIQQGNFSKEQFEELPADKQKEVNDLLFGMSSNNINLFHGASALEFIVISSLRLMFLYKENRVLSADDRKVEKFLEDILEKHELGNRNVSSTEWLFDYLSYADYKTSQILKNREEHIERKEKITGNA